ncbi:uncharacterized protein SCHCODRAFT_02718424, partial [Schizophyllum commune H4-8]|uniref:uncharacterized protein n=1 Tax=Schizophyllum commune (strain H4-8 / FGSC 9210) TaxID=578458 RepID=UPI002160E0AC
MEKRRDGSEFDSFPVFGASPPRHTRYNAQQLARHPTDRSHNPPYFPAGAHVHGIPSPGERRKIECALRAHPPNLPTFRWAGLGRGPPRSDPEICDAGLEDWAATGHGIGPASNRSNQQFTPFLTLSYLPFASTFLPQYFLVLVLCESPNLVLVLSLTSSFLQAITSTATTRYGLPHLTTTCVDATLIFCASMRAQQTCNWRGGHSTTFGLERAAVRPPTTAGLHAVSVEEQQDGLTAVLISVSLRSFSPPAAPRASVVSVGELILLRRVSWITSAQAMSAERRFPPPPFLSVGVWDILDCRRHTRNDSGHLLSP